MCDAVICDPPYSDRTHNGHQDGASLANKAGIGHTRSDGKIDAYRPRRDINYLSWNREDIEEFLNFWITKNTGWFVCFSDSDLCATWRSAFESYGLCGFQPIPVLIPGMTVRFTGDGPSSWAVYANVARPKSHKAWGTLPGGYYVKQEKTIAVGGKPRGKHYVEPRGYAGTPGTGPEGMTCRQCKHYVTLVIQSGRTFPKCILNKAKWTGGRGSDIRISTPACARFEQKP